MHTSAYVYPTHLGRLEVAEHGAHPRKQHAYVMRMHTSAYAIRREVAEHGAHPRKQLGKQLGKQLASSSQL